MIMEQKIKISGDQSLRYGDVVILVNEDRISELPEDLLVKILSSLPTENVVATSVLSKRWRSLWKMVPYLKFTEYHKTEDRFSNIVCTSLLSLKAPVLESLHVEASERSGSWDLGIWIGIAFARHVRALVLDFHSEGNMIRILNVVCTYNSTLETLKLKNCIYLHFPSPVCFKSLKKLHLNLVEFQDEESVCNLVSGCRSLQDSVCNLVSGCPSLQDLFVKQKINTDVATFTIAVPSLQRLTIEEDCYPGEGFGGYVINAPSLKYLNIIGFKGLEFCLIETAPKLMEAKIINVSNISNENILVSQTSARRLSLHLSPLEIKYPTGIIFYQLVYLELCTRKRKWWNLLSLMLDSSPKLQILKLMDPFWYGRRACPVGWEWEQPKRVPECLLFHLETFVWIRYDWNREDEKEVATYILKNARRLKKTTFSTKTINSEEHEKLEKRCEMLKELASVVRASTSCDVMFESE